MTYRTENEAATIVADSYEDSYSSMISAEWYKYDIPVSILGQVFGIREQDYFTIVDECTLLHQNGIVKNSGLPERAIFSTMANAYQNLGSYKCQPQTEQEAEWRALRHKLREEIFLRCLSRSSIKPFISSWNKCFDIKRRELKGHEKLVSKILQLQSPDFNAIVFEEMTKLLDKVDYEPTTAQAMCDKITGAIMTRISSGEWMLRLSSEDTRQLDLLLERELDDTRVRVLREVYGIGDYRLPMPKPPASLGIPQWKIYDLHKKALSKLRKSFRAMTQINEMIAPKLTE